MGLGPSQVPDRNLGRRHECSARPDPIAMRCRYARRTHRLTRYRCPQVSREAKLKRQAYKPSDGSAVAAEILVSCFSWGPRHSRVAMHPRLYCSRDVDARDVREDAPRALARDDERDVLAAQIAGQDHSSWGAPHPPIGGYFWRCPILDRRHILNRRDLASTRRGRPAGSVCRSDRRMVTRKLETSPPVSASVSVSKLPRLC